MIIQDKVNWKQLIHICCGKCKNSLPQFHCDVRSSHSPYKTTLFRAALFCVDGSSGSDDFFRIHELESVPGKTSLMSVVGLLHNWSVCDCSNPQSVL